MSATSVYADPALDQDDRRPELRATGQSKTLVADIEKYAMDTKRTSTRCSGGIGSSRTSTPCAAGRIGSNHYTNQDLETVWLGK